MDLGPEDLIGPEVLRSKEWTDGFYAAGHNDFIILYEDGKDERLIYNPYLQGTIEFQEWYDGYSEAQKDLNIH